MATTKKPNPFAAFLKKSPAKKAAPTKKPPAKAPAKKSAKY